MTPPHARELEPLRELVDGIRTVEHEMRARAAISNTVHPQRKSLAEYADDLKKVIDSNLPVLESALTAQPAQPCASALQIAEKVGVLPLTQGAALIESFGQSRHAAAQQEMRDFGFQHPNDVSAMILSAKAAGAASAYGDAANECEGSQIAGDQRQCDIVCELAERIRGLTDADATCWQQEQDRQQLEKFLPHAGLILVKDKDRWECFCGESLGGYSLPFDERRKFTSLNTEMEFARVKHREHICNLASEDSPRATPGKGERE